MLKLLKWEEVVLPEGLTFRVDPIGSKSSAPSDAFRTYNLYKKSIYNDNTKKHVHDISVRSYKQMRN